MDVTVVEKNTNVKIYDALIFIQAYETDKNELPTINQIAKAVGCSKSTASEALHENKSLQAGLLGPVKLSKAQEYHINAIIARRKREFETEFNERVRLAMLEHNESYRAGLEKLKIEAQKKFDLYEKLVNKHKPLFTEAEFTMIITCLHPDNVASKEKRDEAFKLVNLNKLALMGKGK
jgi:hypothetical protein